MKALPESFIARIVDLHGRTGHEWLDALPALLASIEKQWGIRVDDPFSALTYHYVAPATLEDGTDAVLKLGVPGELIECEAACLWAYDGRGAPNIFEHSAALGAMLLERVRPGLDIKDLSESKAIEAAVNVMAHLHQAPVPGRIMPTVTQWGNGFQRLREKFFGGTGPLPHSLVDEAEEMYFELADSMAPSVLLHGDLHHENILVGSRMPWIAIDPQGVIGEPAYEVGAFLRNPMPDLLHWTGLNKMLERRVIALSECLGIDKRRIAGWGYAQAVLSGIWALEDHGSGWEGPLEVADALRRFVAI